MINQDQIAYIYDYNVLQVIKKSLENIAKVSGIANRPTYEIKPNYNATNGETVLRGGPSSFIILGRDRNAGIESGKGGLGTTGASAIDIVAGLGSTRPVDQLYGQQVFTDKDFNNDSARIYISQKSDIDSYLGLEKINVKVNNKSVSLENTVDKSCVAAKADVVRITARENIKLITWHKGMNSNNKKSQDGGIDIIAGYNATMTDSQLDIQPMVKGNNLKEALDAIIKVITDVQSTVSTFMETQKKINDILATHVHQSNAAGLPTTPVIGRNGTKENFELLTRTLPNIIENNKQQAKLDGDYLKPTNKKYILSMYNRVN